MGEGALAEMSNEMAAPGGDMAYGDKAARGSSNGQQGINGWVQASEVWGFRTDSYSQNDKTPICHRCIRFHIMNLKG